jgi:hypothetical protein
MAPLQASAAAAPPVPSAANGSSPSPGEDDDAGARLIALNMALNGASREEAGRYLAANFELADPAGLLDDVYSRLGQ